MTSEQREELKQAALKATPGPWDFDTAETPYKIAGGEVVGGDALPWGAVYTTAEYETPDGTESLVVASEIGCDNGRFVARANPTAILSLIAQVEALNRKNLELQRMYDERGLQIDRLEVALQRAKVEALTVPQWIKTSKRRPAENQQVFICIVQKYSNAPTTYNVSIAYYYNDEFREGGHSLYTPSHWMPLVIPSAPTIPAIPGTKEGA